MIAVLQRVNSATVEVERQTIARINAGLLVLIGVQAEDDQAGMAQMLTRLLNYRVFADADDKMNLSLVDIAGGLLLVPQFTLAANTRKGRRPSFTSAAPPEHGRRIFEAMVELAREQFPGVESGRFGADMQIALVNNGPVTFILEQ